MQFAAHKAHRKIFAKKKPMRAYALVTAAAAASCCTRVARTARKGIPPPDALIEEFSSPRNTAEHEGA
jgi:hypothetical protein